MLHKVLVAAIGEGDYLTRLIHAILDNEMIPEENMFLSAKNKEALNAAAGHQVTVCADESAAILRGEILFVCASKREFATVLAPIAQVTRKRVVVAICDDSRVNLDFVGERIAFGTEIIIAHLCKDETGKLIDVQFTAGQNVRPFLQPLCKEMVLAML